MIDRVWRIAAEPVPGDTVAVMRIGVGVVVAVVAARLLLREWVDALWLEPARLFGWGAVGVPALPAPWLHVLVVAVGLAGLSLAFGWWARVAAAVVATGLAYLELLDATTYVNHYYWLVLTAGLLAVLPTDRVLAVRGAPGGPWVGRWVVWVVRAQVAMVYAFAAVAKLDADWLGGEPLATWLSARTDLPVIGPLLAFPVVAVGAAWAGLLFDATIVLWLSVPATRPLAYAAVIAFHGVTYALFPAIGVFPFVMVLGTLAFLPPGAIVRRLGRHRLAPAGRSRRAPRPVVAGVLAAYGVLMVILPLRHFAIPGDVTWTGEGGTFAWRVMLTERAGGATFVVTDPDTGAEWLVDRPVGITERQHSMMTTDANLLVRAAHWVAEDAGGGVEVRVDAVLAVNGRRADRWVDPTVDLAAEPLAATHRPWIVGPGAGVASP